MQIHTKIHTLLLTNNMVLLTFHKPVFIHNLNNFKGRFE